MNAIDSCDKCCGSYVLSVDCDSISQYRQFLTDHKICNECGVVIFKRLLINPTILNKQYTLIKKVEKVAKHKFDYIDLQDYTSINKNDNLINDIVDAYLQHIETEFTIEGLTFKLPKFATIGQVIYMCLVKGISMFGIDTTIKYDIKTSNGDSLYGYALEALYFSSGINNPTKLQFINKTSTLDRMNIFNLYCETTANCRGLLSTLKKNEPYFETMSISEYTKLNKPTDVKINLVACNSISLPTCAKIGHLIAACLVTKPEFFGHELILPINGKSVYDLTLNCGISKYNTNVEFRPALLTNENINKFIKFCQENQNCKELFEKTFCFQRDITNHNIELLVEYIPHINLIFGKFNREYLVSVYKTLIKLNSNNQLTNIKLLQLIHLFFSFIRGNDNLVNLQMRDCYENIHPENKLVKIYLRQQFEQDVGCKMKMQDYSFNVTYNLDAKSFFNNPFARDGTDGDECLFRRDTLPILHKLINDLYNENYLTAVLSKLIERRDVKRLINNGDFGRYLKDVDNFAIIIRDLLGNMECNKLYKQLS